MSEEIGLKSKCYQCQSMIEPYEVIPRREVVYGNGKNRKTHSCNGCDGNAKI